MVVLLIGLICGLCVLCGWCLGFNCVLGLWLNCLGAIRDDSCCLRSFVGLAWGLDIVVYLCFG